MDTVIAWLFLLIPVAVVLGTIGFFVREVGILQTLLALAALVAIMFAAFIYAKGTVALGWEPSTAGGVFAFALFVGSYVIWRIAGGGG